MDCPYHNRNILLCQCNLTRLGRYWLVLFRESGYRDPSLEERLAIRANVPAGRFGKLSRPSGASNPKF